jgi:hypothetical protein
MRQAIEFESFGAAFKWVRLNDHPSEYAMLNNNLTDALQSLSSVIR